jgi:catechol 2,3-dioxygenase-like lactoylglutathione lyase family enzyme
VPPRAFDSVETVATIDHVTLRVADLASAARLYDRALGLLEFAGERYDADDFHEWNDFSIAASDALHPPTRGLHIGFAAASRAQVDEWWRRLTQDGYEDDGRPGPRPHYSEDYYGAFVRDDEGNSVEAVHHGTATAETGLIDHLWIRVRDLEASKRFYSAIAEAVGARAKDLGDRLQVVTASGTFSLLEGSPTRNLHLALGVPGRAPVAAFHRAALAAGGRDNGGAGERPEYHPGYFAAYALDPDSNNIEAVFHDR